MKIENDAYYTPIATANHCIDKVLEIIGKENISEVIEPSCGNGAFYHNSNLKIDVGYDINPKLKGAIKVDFLDDDLVKPTYKEGRLFIGNPPFGTSMSIAIKFYKKAILMGDFIAFILPASQLNNNIQFYEFDLIYSEDLGLCHYTDRDLQCCFNIYKRNVTGFLNDKPDYTLRDITIIEHRRKKGDYATGKNKDIDENYDYAMCNWGSLGKVPEYVGQYAQEVYFYCHKKEFLERMKYLLSFDVIREYCKSTSMKKISVMRLYKYLGENIEGIK